LSFKIDNYIVVYLTYLLYSLIFTEFNNAKSKRTKLNYIKLSLQEHI